MTNLVKIMRLVLLGASALLALVQQSAAYAIAPDQYAGQRIASVAVKTAQQAQQLPSLVYDVFNSRVIPGHHVRVRATDEELERLRQEGYAVDVEVTDIAQHLRDLDQQHKVRRHNLKLPVQRLVLFLRSFRS